MNFLPILLFCTGVVTCVYSNTLPQLNDADGCPPPDSIRPCTCYRASETREVTAKCANFTNANDLTEIFDRNLGWNLHEVWILHSVMAFIPAKIFKGANFRKLKITDSSLVTLFDKAPVSTPRFNLYLNNVKLQRGFDWSSIANVNLYELEVFYVKIKIFGKEFKKHIPKGVERLWFDDTRLTKITDQAFSELKNLDSLALRFGSLKKISRDMFPRPWIVSSWNLRNQKFTSLPEDIFVDLPKLKYFVIEGNLLTTISEKVFTKQGVNYYFRANPINCNCQIKWILQKINPKSIFGECLDPPSLKGTQLRDLNTKSFSYCQ